MSISPSAISVYQRCPRLYAFTYVNGEWDNEPPGAPTIAGKKAHALLENWFKNQVPIPTKEKYSTLGWTDGNRWKFSADSPGLGWESLWFDFRIGQMAQKLLERVPLSGGLSEHKFSVVIEGVEFKGVVDYLLSNHIVDFKTTSSSLDYAKTSRKLFADPQRLIYAAAFPDRQYSRWITGEWHNLEVVVGERENDPHKDKEKFKLHVLEPAQAMCSMTKGMDPLSLPLPGKTDWKTGMQDVCLQFGKVCSKAGTCFPKKTRKLTLPAVPTGMEKSTPVDNSESNRTVTEVITKKYLIENLYIDCMPLSAYLPGEALEYSYDYIKAASDEVCADMGVVNPNLVDFGKGPHLVCAQLIAMLGDRPEPIKHLFLETRSAEGRACMQELSARSKFVLKGCY